ncbi:type VI secretion system tip protein VgrG, partial [Brenneria sp. 4F2]|nr:type VI secretion system tip protein VgrG [Brenneria bubanii]
TTPWPRTFGPQTAKVVGPKGESIWTDKYGRVKVKFHWDRLARGDDTSSCWVRVSSAWAGQGFGGVQIPRVGDEVVIDFINGDPDRPIITGRVYNEASMPPWSLPAAATQMGFMSRSKDGSPDNANALRFEDKKGEEQLWLHAERNMDIDVENDETHTIEKNHTHFVGAKEELRVTEDQITGVRGDSIRITGQKRIDNAVDSFTIGSGKSIRLECGLSVLELTAEGDINIKGINFNITVDKSGQINTSSGELHLNPSGGEAATVAPGKKHQEIIQSELDSFFPPANK